MRIGLITGEYPPDQGGVGDYTRELAQALAALTHQVHVLTDCASAVNGQSPSTEAGTQNLTVHRAARDWGWSSWRAVSRLARELRLDVLNVQYQTAAYGMHPAINLLPRWNRLRHGPPLAVTFHDLRVPYLFPKAGPLRWQTVLLLARWADGAIVTTGEDELQLAACRLRTPVERIPIGSNITPQLPAGYQRDLWRARWGITPDDVLLGYFGFLNEGKGGEDLIEALAGLVRQGVPAHLLLIGGRAGTSDPTNAAYADHVDRLVAQRGLAQRVHRTGFVSPEEVSASLTAVDMCVMPYRGGVSLRHGSLHAILAHGRAVVTTQPAVQTPEFRAGHNLLLVPARDVEALASAVMRLATDLTLRARLEAGAAALATEFAWERIAERTADFLERL